eukprot:3577615-Rhodomonas_salina.1
MSLSHTQAHTAPSNAGTQKFWKQRTQQRERRNSRAERDDVLLGLDVPDAAHVVGGPRAQDKPVGMERRRRVPCSPRSPRARVSSLSLSLARALSLSHSDSRSLSMYSLCTLSHSLCLTPALASPAPTPCLSRPI